MKTGMAVGIAIVASLLLNYAIYLQKKAVEALPEVEFKLSWPVIKAFITNGPWLVAQAVNISGFVIYVIALDLAPVSIVEPLIASGVALLAYLAIKNLGERPRRIDIWAICINVLGVVLLGISLLEGLPKDVVHHPIEIWVVAAGAVFLAIMIPLALRGKGADTEEDRRRKSNREAVGLGISVGLFFGMGAVFTRLLMLYLGKSWPLTGIFILACIATYLPGFIILQAALQRGMAVIVAPVYNGIMEFVPIIVGMIVLNERFPRSILLSVLRVVAFCLILMATVILSRRAEGTEEPPAVAELQPSEESSGG